MSSSASSTGSTRLRLHVQLAAEPPSEHFIVTGSQEALGCWRAEDGVQLEWRGSRWETKRPVKLDPSDRLEFKFVRVQSGEMIWEDGPNRVIQVPEEESDLFLKGKFNADSFLRLTEPETDTQAGCAEVWRKRYEEAFGVLQAQERAREERRQEHRLAQEKRAQVADELRAELAQVREQVEELARLASYPPGTAEAEQLRGLIEAAKSAAEHCSPPTAAAGLFLAEERRQMPDSPLRASFSAEPTALSTSTVSPSRPSGLCSTAEVGQTGQPPLAGGTLQSSSSFRRAPAPASPVQVGSPQNSKGSSSPGLQSQSRLGSTPGTSSAHRSPRRGSGEDVGGLLRRRSGTLSMPAFTPLAQETDSRTAKLQRSAAPRTSKQDSARSSPALNYPPGKEAVATYRSRFTDVKASPVPRTGTVP